MDRTEVRGNHDDELEELVMQCLDAADPRAELDRRTADRPHLRESAWSLMQQVARLEQVQPLRAGDPQAGDPSTWPTIPDVELDSLIGRGGQGFVFRGRQTYLGRTVAVKVLAAEWRTPQFLERFRREASMLAGLQHPHIVTCHQAGLTENGECFLVMEFVEGPNLRHWLQTHGRMPVAKALRMARDLATALEAAQQRGFVHRDVKPENVLLQPQANAEPGDAFPFVPKLADLGLARPLQRNSEFTMLTPVGAILGTPVTMAPEQFDAPERVDHRADIYGLGCVLHHALAGQPAFRGTAVTELVLQKATMRGQASNLAIDLVPARVNALVARMIAYDPAARPQNYPSLLAQLDALLPEQPSAAPRRKLLPWIVGTALLSIGVIAWRTLDTRPAIVPPSQAQPRGDADVVAAPAPVDPQTDPLPPGTEQRLFLADETAPMALWTCTDSSRWGLDESSRGVVLNSSRNHTAATRLLPRGAFALRGNLLVRFPGPPSATSIASPANAGWRIVLGEDAALTLLLLRSEAKQGSFRAVLCRQRRLEDGTWQTVAELRALEGSWSDREPLALALLWSGDELSCTLGSGVAAEQGATVRVRPATEWQISAAPRTLALHGERCVAVFTDWVLAATR